MAVSVCAGDDSTRSTWRRETDMTKHTITDDLNATFEQTDRRRFLGRILGAAAAAGLPLTAAATAQAAPNGSGPDAWIAEVKGTHRALFDFPQHKFFFP